MSYPNSPIPSAALSAVVHLSERSNARRSSGSTSPDVTRGRWQSTQPLGIVRAFNSRRYFGFPTIGTNLTGSVRSVSSPVPVRRRILSS